MTYPISNSRLSELEIDERKTSYTAWLKAKVQASLDDPQTSIPHDKMMAEARALLASKKKVRAND